MTVIALFANHVNYSANIENTMIQSFEWPVADSRSPDERAFFATTSLSKKPSLTFACIRAHSFARSFKVRFSLEDFRILVRSLKVRSFRSKMAWSHAGGRAWILSTKEVYWGLAYFWLCWLVAPQVPGALASLDASGDGKIQFDEFLKWLNWLPADQWSVEPSPFHEEV